MDSQSCAGHQLSILHTYICVYIHAVHGNDIYMSHLHMYHLMCIHACYLHIDIINTTFSTPWGRLLSSQRLDDLKLMGFRAATPKICHSGILNIQLKLHKKQPVLRRTLWPSSVPLRGGNKSPMWKVSSPYQEVERRSQHRDRGAGPGSLYKQTLLLQTLPSHAQTSSCQFFIDPLSLHPKGIKIACFGHFLWVSYFYELPYVWN